VDDIVEVVIHDCDNRVENAADGIEIGILVPRMGRKKRELGR